MNIIEQIDARFKRLNAQDIPPILVNIDLNYQQWQQIKAELAKVREEAAKQSMQGEAVEWFARRKGSVDYPFPPYWVPITKAQFESDDFNIPQIELKAHFTYQPDAAAEIAKLTKELEEARKDTDRKSQIATRVINHLKFLNEAIKRCETRFRDEQFGVEWHDAADDCKSDYDFTVQLVDELEAALNIKGGAE